MIEKITYLAKIGTQRLVDNIKEKIIEAKADMIASVGVISNKIAGLSDQIDDYEEGMDWKQAVDTYADIATTYPNPEDGWTVNVKDTDYTYRYNGEEWIPISANTIPNATTTVNGLMTTEKVVKLNSLYNYVLPIAGTAELGGIKPDEVTLVTDPETGVARAIGENNNLSDLTNVQITNPVNGQALIYDETRELWVNGGGSQIQLDDVTGASVQAITATQSAVLTWTDPSDVVISGRTLAEWAGTKIVRKVGSAPTDENDGTLIVDSKVRNQYSSTGYTDSGLAFDTTYYYRFFPYTTNEVYTVGTALSCSLEVTTVVIPEQTGSLTYDGTSQSPIWTSSAGYTASGTQSATNAGTYYMTATLLPGYMWSDETTTAKQIPWSINKATSEIVATPDTIVLNDEALSGSSIISNLLGREVVSTVIQDDTIATVAFQNNTVTATTINEETGETSIIVTTNSSNNYLESIKNISLVASFGTKIVTWADGTDEELAAMLNAHYSGEFNIHDYWHVGDSRVVGGNNKYTFVIMHPAGKTLVSPVLGHNTGAFIVGLKDCIDAIVPQPSSNSFYLCTEIKNYCNITFKNLINGFSSTFCDLFKEHQNKVGTGYNTVTTENDYFCIPSEYEVYGNTGLGNTKETGTQYDWYKTSSNRIKRNYSYRFDRWWTRSTIGENSTTKKYVAVLETGNKTKGTVYADMSYGLSPFGVI